MMVSSEPTSHNIPSWLIRFCQQLSTTRGFIVSTIFNIVLSLSSTWFFTANDIDYAKLPVLAALFRHWPVALIAFVLLALLYGLIWAIGQMPVTPSPANLKKRYLSRKIFDTQDLAIEGIPLIPPKVQLDEIFIPLQLRPHQLDIDIDQWLTAEQKAQLREGMHSGIVAEEVERVLINAEQRYELGLRSSKDRVTMLDLWQYLNRDHPAAVIQGYPGMGKSTLLLRLTLFMARRGLGKPDPLEEPFSPILVPLFLRLGQYATFLRQAKDGKQTAIWDYLSAAPKELDALASPEMLAWLRMCLEHGQCLVLFDGLDEVSDLQTRTQVQEAIRTFIADISSKTNHAVSFNRFLITSRVAGYDKNAFPGYPHYTIDELMPEQIMAFLPRWCRANARGNTYAVPSQEAEEQIVRQAAEIEERLKNALQSHQGVRELVQNPFLLTLLAIMQQNGIELPRRRVELYTLLTKVLLEYRNAQRGLPEIPEEQTVQRLGPIAYQMQVTKNSFASKQDVLASICTTIMELEKVEARQARKDAAAFLERVRVRGGIFVLRTGDYYGFFHRTFQEYFAARHMLSRLATDPRDEEADLLQKARRQDDLWREPFLLALAYQINNVGSKTWDMVRALLAPTTDHKQYAHDVLLSGECLVEAKESTIPHDLERNFVLALLSIYQNAQQVKDVDTLGKSEAVMQRLLLNISSEAMHSTRLSTLQECMLDHVHPHRQRATLTMLTMIAQSLLSCEDIVFAKLIPPLLGLTGLPAVGTFEPVFPAGTPDLALVDLALAALSFLGAHGPAGASIKQVRADFEPYLPLLARYSLEKGFPITPAVVPLSNDKYEGYEQAVMRCRQTHDTVEKSEQVITVQDVVAYIPIQRDLLQYAEEVCYPAHTHLLEMLRRSQAQPSQSWEQIWQAYLREQMRSGTYLTYQVCALLWVTLFDEQQAQQTLAALLLSDLSTSVEQQRYAQSFMLSVVEDLRYLRYLRSLGYFIDLSYLMDLRYLRYFKALRCLRYLRYFRELRYLRYFRELRYLSHLSYLAHLSYFRNLLDLKDLSYLSYFRDSSDLTHLSYVRETLFTAQVIQELRQRLPICAEAEQVELLNLLLGRVLQIQEADEKGPEVEREIAQIVQVALPFALADSDTRDVTLDISRYLPVRTEQEVIYVLGCVQSSRDDSLQDAFLQAVKYSFPESEQAWVALEEGARTSSSAKVHKIVKERLAARR